MLLVDPAFIQYVSEGTDEPVPPLREYGPRDISFPLSELPATYETLAKKRTNLVKASRVRRSNEFQDLRNPLNTPRYSDEVSEEGNTSLFDELTSNDRRKYIHLPPHPACCHMSLPQTGPPKDNQSDECHFPKKRTRSQSNPRRGKILQPSASELVMTQRGCRSGAGPCSRCLGNIGRI